jgi:protease I
MSNELKDTKIAFLATDGVEQIELTKPWQAVEAAGGTPVLVSVTSGTIQGMEHDEKGDAFDVDMLVTDTTQAEFDGLVLPGGVMNPDILRMDDSAVAFVRSFAEAGKPIGAICHGPWLLVESGVVDGHTVTSWPSLHTDIENAGGTWVDQEVVVDEGIVTSRKPEDLNAFCAKIVEEFAEGVHEQLAEDTQTTHA